MSTYVIGDLHGNYKGFIQAVERSPIQKGDTLIFLGDYVDGHKDSFLLIEKLLELKSTGYNTIFIRGNHDEWMREFIMNGHHGSLWQQGALNTAKSYMDNLAIDNLENFKPSDIPDSHIDFFTYLLPYYKDDDSNIFVHGGFNRHLELKKQRPHVFWWDRDLWSQALTWKSMSKGMLEEKPGFKIIEKCNEIFIGHTSTQFWDSDIPMNAANIWNLDTGGGWYGKVTIMNIETKEFWQSDNGDTLYPDFKGR